MAKLNTPKAFEKTLLSGDLREKLDTFVDFVNQNFDQLIRAFANQLSFQDNFIGRVINVVASNDTPTNLELGGVTPVGVLVLKTDVGIKSFTLTTLSNGLSQINFKFDEAKAVKTRSADITDAPNVVYEIEGLSTIGAGDVATISGFGNKDNNGSFLVLNRVENRITVFNDNASAGNESKSSFTGDRETTKNVSLFVLT